MAKKKYLYLLFSAALIIRLYKVSLIRCIANDGIAYINAAFSYLDGGGFNAIWPPLYPWFIGILTRGGIHPELGGQLVSVFFGVLTVGAVYFFTRSVFSSSIAFLSAILCVFHPYLVRYSAEVLADSLFTFLITITIFCGWVGIKKKGLSLAVLTGLFAGFTYLTKPEGIFILPIIILWWIIPGIIAKSDKFHLRVVSCLCMLGVFLTLSLPYLFFLRNETGRWTISQKDKLVFSIALKDEGLTDEYLDVSPLEYAEENPAGFLKKIGKGLLTLLGRMPDAYNPLLFIFLIIGLFSGIKEKKFLYYILTFLVPFFLGYATLHPGRRYLVGWVPLTLFIAAYGMEWTKKYTGRVWIAVFAAVLFMAPKTFEPIRDGGKRWKEAGLWIRDNQGKKGAVMCEDERVAFYAGNIYIPFADGDFKEADYIVTDKEIAPLSKARRTAGGLNIYYP